MKTNELWTNGLDLAAIQGWLRKLKVGVVVIAYMRVSSKPQVDEGNSLFAQEQNVRRECHNRFGRDCAIIWIVDEGIPGSVPFRNEKHKNGRIRKGLTMVCDLVNMGIGQYVMVARCSRLARKTEIWCDFHDRVLKPRGAHLISACEGYDTSSLIGKRFIDLLMAVAQIEVAGKKDHTRDGLKERRRMGYHMGKAPYGWVKEDKRRLPNGRRPNIQVNPEQAPVVKRIFEDYLAGRSCIEIADELTARKTPNQSGECVWDAWQVLRVLQQPAHCGRVQDLDGNWIHGRHYHNRIVGETEFDKVQSIFWVRYPKNRYPKPPEVTVFKYIVKCRLCGKSLDIHRRMTDHGEEYSYMCRRRGKKHLHTSYRCSLRRVNGLIDKAIMSDAFVRRLEQAASICRTSFAEREMEQLRVDEKSLEAALRTCKEQFAADLQKCLSGVTDEARIALMRNSFRAARATIEDQLTEVRERMSCLEKTGETDQVIKAISTVREHWNDISWEEKRELSLQLIEEATLEPDSNSAVLHLRLLSCAPVVHHLDRYVIRDAKLGLEGARSEPLAVARSLKQGYSPVQIARMHGVNLGHVLQLVRQLLKRAGTDDVREMLEMVTPIVERREAQGLLDWKPKLRSRRPIDETEARFVQLYCAGTSHPETARLLGVKLNKVLAMKMRICALWQVYSREEFVAEAVRLELVRAESVCAHSPKYNTGSKFPGRVIAMRVKGGGETGR